MFRKWVKFKQESEGLTGTAFGLIFLGLWWFVVIASLKSDIITTAMFIDGTGNTFPQMANNYVGWLFEDFLDPVSNYAENMAVLFFGLGIALHYLYATRSDVPMPNIRVAMGEGGLIGVLSALWLNPRSRILIALVLRGAADVYTDAVAITPPEADYGKFAFNILYAVLWYEFVSEFLFVICIEIVIDKLIYPLLSWAFGWERGNKRGNNRNQNNNRQQSHQQNRGKQQNKGKQQQNQGKQKGGQRQQQPRTPTIPDLRPGIGGGESPTAGPPVINDSSMRDQYRQIQEMMKKRGKK